MKRLIIGTRGSELALWQARCVRSTLLAKNSDLLIELQIIKTKGDRMLDSALSQIGDKGLFTKEIEKALLAGEIDLAVHSLKDLPTSLEDGLAIGAVLPREDPADVLVAKDNLTLQQLPAGAKVLSGSLRRQAQLLHRRRDLIIEDIRGNVPTRLKKFQQSGALAMVLARAGLVRLGLAGHISQRLEPDEFLPACGQGALAVEIHQDDNRMAELLRPLDDLAARAATSAERVFLCALGGGCQVPIGAWARLEDGQSQITISGMVASLDGSKLLRRTISSEFTGLDSAAELGRRLANELWAGGGREILDEVLGESRPVSEGR